LVVVDFSRSILFSSFFSSSSSSSCSPFYTFLFVFAQKMGEGDEVRGLAERITWYAPWKGERDRCVCVCVLCI
jgi:hypothetical protein